MSRMVKLWLVTLLALSFYSNAASANSELSFKCGIKAYEIIVERGNLTMVGTMSGKVVYEASVGVKNQPETKSGDWLDGVTETKLRLKDVALGVEGLEFKTVNYHTFYYGESKSTAHSIGTWTTYRVYKKNSKYWVDLDSFTSTAEGPTQYDNMTLKCQ